MWFYGGWTIEKSNTFYKSLFLAREHFCQLKVGNNEFSGFCVHSHFRFTEVALIIWSMNLFGKLKVLCSPEVLRRKVWCDMEKSVRKNHDRLLIVELYCGVCVMDLSRAWIDTSQCSIARRKEENSLTSSQSNWSQKLALLLFFQPMISIKEKFGAILHIQSEIKPFKHLLIG